MNMTSNLPNLIAPGLSGCYKDEWKRDTGLDQYKQFVNIETSDQAYEEYTKTSGIGPAVELTENQVIPTEDIVGSGKLKISQKTFGKAVEISVQMWQDDLYGVVSRAGKLLAAAGKTAFALQGFDLFNAGFVTTTRTTLDTLALFSAAHTLLNPSGLAPGNPTTFSNTATAALGYDSLQAAIESFALSYDEQGFPSAITPKFLVVKSADMMLAEQLTSAGRGQYGVANNEVQPSAFTKITPVVCDWLTNTGQWLLLGAKADHDLMMFIRMQPILKHYDNPFTMGALFSTMGRCAVGHVVPNGVYSAKP